MGPPDTFKAQSMNWPKRSRIQVRSIYEKTFLSLIGPRMVAYLAPGRSATTNDDSLEAALKNGLSTTAAVTAMQSLFPKLTLVAEVKNPEAFGKALDTVMIAINNELKAQAIEKEAEDRAAAEKATAGGGGHDGRARSRKIGPSGAARQVIPSSR